MSKAGYKGQQQQNNTDHPGLGIVDRKDMTGLRQVTRTTRDSENGKGQLQKDRKGCQFEN